MHTSTSPNIVNFTPSTPAPDPVASGQAATPEPAQAPAPDTATPSGAPRDPRTEQLHHSDTPSPRGRSTGQAEAGAVGEHHSTGSPRGRKSGYSPRIIEMMCVPIREHGVSDSVAAEGVGMSSSTISRWKQQYPELGPQLQQAREQARLHHLRIINQAAEAENGKGWRASAWMLERLFPGDYSPRMTERALWREFEEYRREREAQQFEWEQIEEESRQYDEAVAQKKRAAAAAEAEAAKCAAASEAASHNSRNAAAPGPQREPESQTPSPLEGPKALSAVQGSHAQRTVEGQSAPAEHPASTFDTPFPEFPKFGRGGGAYAGAAGPERRRRAGDAPRL
jgi:transposase